MKKQVDIALGKQIRAIREAKGDSQKAAAESTTVKNQNGWVRIEETGRIPVAHADSVSAYTGIDVEKLLKISPKRRSTGSASSMNDIPVIEINEVAKLYDESVTLAHLSVAGGIVIPIPKEQSIEMSFAFALDDNFALPWAKKNDMVVIDLSGFSRIKEDCLVAAVTADRNVVVGMYKLRRNGFALCSESGKSFDSLNDGLALLGPVIKIVVDPPNLN